MRQNLVDISVAVLGRSPSPQELAAWMEDAENGQTLGELTSLLLLSQEGQARFPETGSTADYLTNAYQQLFGRAPDAAGLAYWETQLEAGNVDFTSLVAVLVEGARAETGNPNDATLFNARAEAAENYLTSVEAGDIEFDIEAASQAVTAIERGEVADPDLEPELPGDGETPPGEDNGGGDPTPPGDGGDPTPQPNPEPTFAVDSIQQAAPASPGAAEVQSITLPTTLVQGQVFTINHDGVTYEAAALGENPTATDLATVLNAAATGAEPPAPFSVSLNDTSDALELTWLDADAAPSEADATLAAAAVTDEVAPAVNVTAVTDDGTAGTPQADGVAEVQTITAPTNLVAGQTFTLSHDGVVYEAAALGENPTLADLATALNTAATGATPPAPFTIGVNQDETALQLTWVDANAAPSNADASLIADAFTEEVAAPVNLTATTDPGAAETTPGGGDGMAEVQTIAAPASLVAGQTFTLNHDSVAYEAAALGASPTLSDLATALNAAATNATTPAPFTVGVNTTNDALELTWVDANVAPSGVNASLTADAVNEEVAAPVNLTATTADGSAETPQADGVAEVQTITPPTSLVAGQTFTLSHDSVTYEAAALGESPTLADLATALNTAATGSTPPAPFTVGVNQDETALQLTWLEANAAPSNVDASLTAEAVTGQVEPAVDAITASVDDGQAGVEQTNWSASFDIANTLDGEDYTYSLTLTEQVENPTWTGSVDFGVINNSLEEIAVTVDGTIYTASETAPIFVDGEGNQLEGATPTSNGLSITQAQSFVINGATIKNVGEEAVAVPAENITAPTADIPEFDLSFDVAAENVTSIADIANNLANQFNSNAEVDGLFTASVNEDSQLVVTSDTAEVNYGVADTIGVAVTEMDLDLVA